MSQSCRKTDFGHTEWPLQARFEVPRDEDRRVMSLPLISLSLGRKQTFIRHDTDTDLCLLSFVEKLARKEVGCGGLGGKVSTVKAVETEGKE